jgi:hypothetical protein
VILQLQTHAKKRRLKVTDMKVGEENEFQEDDQSFPWPHVEASRHDQQLQKAHPISKAKEFYASAAKPCPECQAAATKLQWFYFQSPEWTWKNECGRAGWMTVCDKCHRQVDFFCDAMN